MKQDKAHVYSTIIVLAAALLAVHFLFQIKYLDYASLALMLISIIFFPAARLISKGWMKFAEVIGAINSKIILSVMFYLILTPIALIYRLVNKDVLRLKKKTGDQGYYIERNHTYLPGDFDKTF